MNRILTFLIFFLFSLSTHASVVYYLAAAPEREIRLLANNPNRLSQFLFTQNPNGLYLDKAWHGLHWLLARNAESTDKPASKIILGGKEIGQDLGYGKARHFSPVEVKQIAKLLASIQPEDLKKNYAPDAMDSAKVYPEDWKEWEQSGDHPFEMLQSAFQDLKSFYQRAAKSGYSVVYARG